MPLFLVVYNQATGAVDVTEYADRDRDAAVARRSELERVYRLQSQMEVVLLGARSLDVLKQTHGRYFHPVDELIHSA